MAKPKYTVKDKRKQTVFTSDSLEACLDFCRTGAPPLKVFRGKTLLAYKTGNGQGRGRPKKKLELLDVE